MTRFWQLVALLSSAACSHGYGPAPQTLTPPPSSVPARTKLTPPQPLGLSSSGPTEIRGRLVFWKRQICNTATECGIPESIAPPVDVDLVITPPRETGAHLVAHQTFTSLNWSTDLMMVWVNPAPGDTTPSYLVTQIQLSQVAASSVTSAPTPLISAASLADSPQTSPTPASPNSAPPTGAASGAVVIAECSRYDDVASVHFLMPGSCSGAVGNIMYGVSMISVPNSEPTSAN